MKTGSAKNTTSSDSEEQEKQESAANITRADRSILRKYVTVDICFTNSVYQSTARWSMSAKALYSAFETERKTEFRLDH